MQITVAELEATINRLRLELEHTEKLRADWNASYHEARPKLSAARARVTELEAALRLANSIVIGLYGDVIENGKFRGNNGAHSQAKAWIDGDAARKALGGSHE